MTEEVKSILKNLEEDIEELLISTVKETRYYLSEKGTIQIYSDCFDEEVIIHNVSISNMVSGLIENVDGEEDLRRIKKELELSLESVSKAEISLDPERNRVVWDNGDNCLLKDLDKFIDDRGFNYEVATEKRAENLIKYYKEK